MSGILLYPHWDAKDSQHYKQLLASGHFDEAGAVFGAKQLTFTEVEVQEQVEVSLTYTQAFPQEIKGNEGDKTIEYMMGASDGIAEQIADNGKFNRVQYNEEPIDVPVREYGLEYAVSYQELQACKRNNTNMLYVPLFVSGVFTLRGDFLC